MGPSDRASITPIKDISMGSARNAMMYAEASACWECQAERAFENFTTSDAAVVKFEKVRKNKSADVVLRDYW